MLALICFLRTYICIRHLDGYMLEVVLRCPCPPLPRPSICSFVDAAQHLESTLNFYHSLISCIQISQHVLLT